MQSTIRDVTGGYTKIQKKNKREKEGPSVIAMQNNQLSIRVMPMIYLLSEGWKEELLKHVDEDVLPAFMGGKRTDPDGDPQCKTFITAPQKCLKNVTCPTVKESFKNPRCSKNGGLKTIQRDGQFRNAIVFDNSYSWMYQKEIYYRARLRGPNDDENLKWTL
ncbi:hypothetical protein CEXT_107761 [Caerostris extrusa]|uniref:Uncharacterized protein n=1 Tax=Caerostris extrusa TaxID=172846 RepID=A0AAV4WHT7_CAEEX|nr:hypothetical protein CEXT_107761 [Caerostris extrusa]